MVLVAFFPRQVTESVKPRYSDLFRTLIIILELCSSGALLISSLISACSLSGPGSMEPAVLLSRRWDPSDGILNSLSKYCLRFSSGYSGSHIVLPLTLFTISVGSSALLSFSLPDFFFNERLSQLLCYRLLYFCHDFIFASFNTLLECPCNSIFRVVFHHQVSTKWNNF